MSYYSQKETGTEESNQGDSVQHHLFLTENSNQGYLLYSVDISYQPYWSPKSWDDVFM